jgi:hypothetical protein
MNWRCLFVLAGFGSIVNGPANALDTDAAFCIEVVKRSPPQKVTELPASAIEDLMCTTGLRMGRALISRDAKTEAACGAAFDVYAGEFKRRFPNRDAAAVMASICPIR